ncbi:MAG: hypothetical protein ACI9SB_000167 [Candidatus Azotimanducaceae bacterium]|jgi:hypothetical protein
MYSAPWSPYEPVRWCDSDDHQYHRNVLVTAVVDNEGKKLLITIVLLVGVFDGFTYFSSRPLFNEMRDEFQPLIADSEEALTFEKTQSALFLVMGHTGKALEGINVSALLPRTSNISVARDKFLYCLRGLYRRAR